jgi:hypothetical protein
MWHVYGKKTDAYWVLVGKPEGKSLLGKPGVDGSIILRWIFRKWDVELFLSSARAVQTSKICNPTLSERQQLE